MAAAGGYPARTPQRFATRGLFSAAGRMPHRLKDPVGHWDSQTSTADWRIALNIARGVDLDDINPANGLHARSRNT